MTLVEFLLARIAEDEFVAENSRGRWHLRSRWPAGVLETYLASWSPGRVLAECAAKRATVEHLRSTAEIDDPFQEDAPGLANFAWTPLAIMASVFADHPDFDPAWRTP